MHCSPFSLTTQSLVRNILKIEVINYSSRSLLTTGELLQNSLFSLIETKPYLLTRNGLSHGIINTTSSQDVSALPFYLNIKGFYIEASRAKS